MLRNLHTLYGRFTVRRWKVAIDLTGKKEVRCCCFFLAMFQHYVENLLRKIVRDLHHLPIRAICKEPWSIDTLGRNFAYPSYPSVTQPVWYLPLHFVITFLLACLRLRSRRCEKRYLRNNMYVLTLCLSLALASGQLALCWAPAAPAHKRGGGEQYEVKDKRGAVASESSVCSNIGVGLIKDGGNAADAVSLTTLRKYDWLPLEECLGPCFTDGPWLCFFCSW